MRKTLGLVLLSALAAVLAYLLLPPTVPELARRTVAIFVLAALLWATEALPLFATSLSVIGLEILLLAEKGGMAGQGGLSYTQFLSPFSSGVVILFMGGFLLSKAVSKSALDEAIARELLYPLARSPLLLLYGILAVTGFFSMWMSNTATTAMMYAILGPLLRGVSLGERFRTALVLAVAFGANIGGIGTPVGTPPNAIALAVLRERGMGVSFLQWMLAGVPLAVLLTAVTGLILYGLFRPRAGFSLRPPELAGRRVGREGYLVCLVLVLAVALWLTKPWHGVDEAAVAVVAAALLTAFRILGREDVDSIDWDILILMWGGLSLSNAMELSKLTEWVGRLPFGAIPGPLLPVLFVLLALGLSTFMSNTAAANLILPVAVVASGGSPLNLAFVTAFSCSFAMALPISTPPNAMAFAFGGLRAREMLLAGGAVSVAGALLLIVGHQVAIAFIFG